ncbi:MAG: hypothetical protein IPH08_03780 [Rhodocyclaceae bacterium]|nr:hypothetical protein [Rhodocyclaceae bacterium]MBK6906273.1 hypothetical protein [Rhodocyclaceae bacterium]
MALEELGGGGTHDAPAAAMALAWEFAQTCRDTIVWVAEPGAPNTQQWGHVLLGDPTFVYLEEGDETGWWLDSRDLAPDPLDLRVVALLVLRAPERGGMMALWTRKGDGISRMRTIRPTEGMVLVYRPGHLVWETGKIEEGEFVAIKVVLDARG